MKNLFKKNATTTPEATGICTSILKKNMIKNGIACGIDTAVVIATPIVIKNVADNIDDDYAKKALYVTGGVLWLHQIATTIRQIGKVMTISAAHTAMKDCELYELEAEGEVLLSELNEEMEEIENVREEK